MLSTEYKESLLKAVSIVEEAGEDAIQDWFFNVAICDDYLQKNYPDVHKDITKQLYDKGIIKIKEDQFKRAIQALKDLV